MKKIFGALAAASVLALAVPASATELWDPQLPGADEGYAAAAVGTLPAGVYGILNNYWAQFKSYNSHANSISNANLSALVEVPIVVWVPGIKVLGGDFWTAFIQPFDYTSYGPLANGTNNGNPSTGSGNWGTYNTILVPGFVNWTFGDFHVGAGLRIGVADATTTPADLVNGSWNHKSGLPSGNGYWTIQPDLTASWLHDGWNVSIWAHFPVPVSSTTATTPTGAGYDYKSGAEMENDYTVAKSIGKWTVGLGAFSVNQFNGDTLNGKNVHNIATRYGLGPIVSYQFNGISAEAIINESVYTRNSVGGTIFNFRFVVPF
jgi:hypothetical protein